MGNVDTVAIGSHGAVFDYRSGSTQIIGPFQWLLVEAVQEHQKINQLALSIDIESRAGGDILPAEFVQSLELLLSQGILQQTHPA